MRVLLVATWLVGPCFGAYGLWVYLRGDAAGLGMDAHIYWVAGHQAHPYGLSGIQGGFLYSPLILQVIRPLSWLPWPIFCTVMVTTDCIAFTWLTWPLPWRWRIPLLLLCLQAVPVGNIYGLLAVALVLGLRAPVAWLWLGFTKVTPSGPCVVWFVVRREWAALLKIAGVAIALTAVSVAFQSHLWLEWVRFIAAHHDDSKWLQSMTIVGVAISVYAARTERPQLLPVAVLCMIPSVPFGPHSLMILYAIIRIWRADLPDPVDHTVQPQVART